MAKPSFHKEIQKVDVQQDEQMRIDYLRYIKLNKRLLIANGVLLLTNVVLNSFLLPGETIWGVALMSLLGIGFLIIIPGALISAFISVFVLRDWPYEKRLERVLFWVLLVLQLMLLTIILSKGGILFF